MKLIVNKPVEVQAKWLKVYCGDRIEHKDFHIGGQTYEGTEEFLSAYPQLKGDRGNYRDNQLMLIIDIDSGEVVNWPKGVHFDFYDWKIVDEGQYIVLDQSNNIIADYIGYVPECIGEGGYGDYFEFEIDENGHIVDWEFTQEDLDELYDIEKDN